VRTVFPSPYIVGVIPVIKIYLALGFSSNSFKTLWEILAMYLPCGSKSSSDSPKSEAISKIGFSLTECAISLSKSIPPPFLEGKELLFKNSYLIEI
jgi:hypothetical protein